MALFCSSRSLSTSRVSTARTSIRQRAACGTAARRTRRRRRRRRWRTNSRAWWDASTSPGPVSPLRPPTRTTATVRQPQAVVEGRITLCSDPGVDQTPWFCRTNWSPVVRLGARRKPQRVCYIKKVKYLRILPKAPYLLQIVAPYKLATRYHSVTGIHFNAVLFRKR